MNGLLTRACIASIVLALPGMAMAQTETSEETAKPKTEEVKTEAKEAPAKTEADKKDEEKKEEKKEAAPAPEATPAAAPAPKAEPAPAPEATPAAASAPKAEPAPAAAPAPAPAAAKATPAPAAAKATPAPAPTKKEAAPADKAGATAAAGKAAPGGKGKKKKTNINDFPPGSPMALQALAKAKAWNVRGSVAISMFSSTFAANPDAAAGWSANVGASYRLLPKLGGGPLLLAASIGMSQAIDEGFLPGLGNTSANQFNLTDPRISVVAISLLKEPLTGITFNFNGGIGLPVSLVSQSMGRVMTLRAGGSAIFSKKVGPGSLFASYNASLGYHVGARARTVSTDADKLGGHANSAAFASNCTAADRVECFTGALNMEYFLFNSISASYNFKGFTLGASYALFTPVGHRPSDEVAGLKNSSGSFINRDANLAVSSSPYAKPGQFANNLFGNTSVFLSYGINRYFTTTLSVNAFQNVIRNSDGNAHSPVSPLFDSPEEGTSDVTLSFGGRY